MKAVISGTEHGFAIGGVLDNFGIIKAVFMQTSKYMIGRLAKL
jgi:hypothetical protein